MSYDYKKMCAELEAIVGEYEIAERGSIGKSVMGCGIECMIIGRGAKKLFICGAFHGLEYLTSALLTKFLREYAGKAERGEMFLGYDTGVLYENVTVLVVPMVNPDGVDIAVNGLDPRELFHQKIIETVGIQDFSRVWQANVRGVDINHNFDAQWQRVMEKPAPTKYGGPYPESEPETRAVTELVKREMPDMLIAFHSQGGEIYYDFNGKEGMRSRVTAEKMAEASGYRMCVPEGTAVFGGCKDWFIDKFGREGFTVEIGHGKNPLPLSMLGSVYEENAKIILCAMNELVNC